ncbi:MAG: triple tyrosine motif-containing protein [Ferruginibacter sp.]
MWIATQDGLFKYDSKSFVVYNSQLSDKQHTIGGSDVRNICVDSSHNILWVISSFGGLNGISLVNGKVEYSLSGENTSFLKNVLFSSLCNSEDSLFIGSQKGIYVYIKSKKTISRLNTGQTTFNAPIDNIFKHKNKLYLFTRNDGIYIYDYLMENITYHISNAAISRTNELRFYNVTSFDENTWYAGTSDGIKKITVNDQDSISIDKNPFATIQEVNANNIFGISIDLNKNLWVSNEEKVIIINPVTHKHSIIKENNSGERSDWLESTYAIFCDKQNNIWLGCQKGLAFAVNGIPPFNAYSKSSNSETSINHSYYLSLKDDSTIYVCAENGLYKTNINNSNIEIIDATIPYDYIFTDPNKRIIVSNYKGTFILKSNFLTPLGKIYPEFEQLNQLRINSCIKINDSCLVLGTENYKGIIVWNYRKHSVEQYNKASKKMRLPEDIINNVVLISKDSFAVLGNESFTIVEFSKRTCKKLSLKSGSGKDYVLFFDLCKIKDKYYLSSYGMGVIVLDKNFNILSEISTKNDLSNNGIYKLLPWRDSLLFITTNNGLNIYNTIKGGIKNLYKSDGLHGDAFEETSGNFYNDVLFAGGANGFTAIYPSYIKANSRPPLIYFNKVHIEFPGAYQFDTTNLEAKSFAIPDNAIQTNIYFTGINYSNPERTTFTYRITEQSNSWVNLSTQNFVTLIGLSPGTYHLQVKAANEDGVWSEPKELILIFLPKWYQTWWFYLLIALTVAAILYALYRYRITQIKKQHEIRKNIATDLHDDLGSTLNSIKVFTNLAISGVKQEESLQQVKDNLTEATMSLRDMIWVLDDSLDTVDELITRLKQFALPVAAASNMEASIKADSEVNSRQLTKEEKRNLFLICKEAINNSIKYSDGSQINVSITASGKKIQIVVANNGKGFNVDEVKKGYGLKNMQYRAGQIKYQVILRSTPDGGTQIYIQPL